jgi:fibronectin-binding autotransporter adhesin
MAACGLVTMISFSSHSEAVTLSWTPAGSGDWDLTTANWDPDGAGPMGDGPWAQREIALFNGAGGEIRVVEPIEVSRVIFGTNGYTLSGGPLSLVEKNAGEFVDFAADGNIIGTVDNSIVSLNNVWVNFFQETGTVVFNGESTYVGKTSVRGGVLELNGTVFSTIVDVETGATLRLGADERLNDLSVVTTGALAPGGTVELGGNETIKTYHSVGGDLTGNGTLTADIYDLEEAASTAAGANLGSGQLNVDGPGTTTLGGDAAAEDVNVDSGELLVNGELTGVTDLAIVPDSIVTLGADERVNDQAIIQNTGGTLNLGGTETVQGMNSSGTLGGNGILAAKGGDINLLDGHDSLAGTTLESLQGSSFQVTSNGAVAIQGTAGSLLAGDNGIIDASILDIQSGTLTLGGLMSDSAGIVNVRTGATLQSGSADRFLGDRATVNLERNGTWNLAGTEAIGTLNSTGLLDGSGVLTAVTFQLSDGAVTEVGADLGSGRLVSGPGIVTLNGDAAANFVEVNEGTLNLNGQLTGATEVAIASGATLLNGSAERVNDDATVRLANGGLWTLSGDEAIGTFVSSGLINGGSTLTASLYELSNDAVIPLGTDLGTGVLNSGPGLVTLDGDAAASQVNVTGGTLNLNGQLTDVTDLGIASDGTLVNGSADRVADSATVTVANGGTWTLNGDETIKVLDSSGLLNGGSTLTAENYVLRNGAVVPVGTNLGGGQLATGPGDVTLDGNSAAEDLDVNGGTLTLNGELTAVTDLTIADGGTLVNGSAERIANGATVNLANGGTLTLTGDETVALLNASGLLNGDGTLNAAAYNLSNGATTAVGVNLGAGQLVSGPGEVTLGGDAAAEDVDVDAGTLTLDGELTAVTDLSIADGATVVNGAAERIANGATVNLANGGTLTLNGEEAVALLNASGLLNGDGTLIAGTYNLSNGAATAAGANLGAGQLVSGPGDVTLGGDAAAGDVDVNAGTLTLDGKLTEVTDLSIADGATVVNGAAERIANGATVNLANGGTLTLNGEETVALLNASGLLNGDGTLIAGTYNLSNGAATAAGANLGAGQLVSGPGDVTLGGDAAAEDVDVNAGTLTLDGELTGVTDLSIADGATVVNGAAERIANGATVNLANGGTLTLNGEETVALLNASGLLNGDGTLIAGVYNLSDGAVTEVGADLGAGQLVSGPGEVTINGDAAAEDVDVKAGTLTLNGELTGVMDLSISDGATLVNGSGERLANGATVNLSNGGTLTLNGDEVVALVNTSGLLNGAGTLTAGTYRLSNGAVTEVGADLGRGQLVSGPGLVSLYGDAAAEDVDVSAGTLNLNGELTGVTDLSIADGATLVNGAAERIADGATVNLLNGGTLTLNGDELVALVNASGLLDGAGTLTAGTYRLSDGAVTAAGANLGGGQLVSGPGDVTLGGDSAAEDVDVNAGTLNLNGRLTAVTDLDVANGAKLVNGSAERITSDATVNLANGGVFTLNGDQTLANLNSTGLLNGAGTLSAAAYNLSNGAVTSANAHLGDGTLNVGPGNVILNGDTGADTINLNSGSLVTSGDVTNASGIFTLSPNTIWFVNGASQYNTLRGEGTVNPGGANGDIFVNRGNVSPGIGDDLGVIEIDGDYTERGTLQSQLDPSIVGGLYLGSDLLRGSGALVLTDDGILSPSPINGLTSEGVLIGHRFNIIDAARGISGSWGEITDGNNAGAGGRTIDSQFFFDVATGDMVALGLMGDQTTSDFEDLTENKLTILDAVIDGATDSAGNYDSADGAEGTVLNGILTTGEAGDLDTRVESLGALSPEGYAGSIDYTLQATRNYSRVIMDGTPLFYNSKYELSVGYTNLGLASASSNDANDYDLQSNGAYIGIQSNTTTDFTFGSYLAFDSGSIDAGRLDLDAKGIVFGGYVEFAPQNPMNRWRGWGALSYGSYEFDGSRTGFLSELSVPNFDGSAFMIGAGVDYLAYENNGLRLIPNAGLSFFSASTDGFTEKGGADALSIDGQDQNSTLLQLAFRLEYQKPGEKFSFRGEMGWQHDLSDTHRDVVATLGSTDFRVNAPGLGEDAFFLDVGAAYDFNERYQLNAGYHAEFRRDADTLNSFNLGLKARF